MSTTWKAIPGYEGLYEVSDEGSVRSIAGVFRGAVKPRPIPRGVRPSHDRGGYKRVQLSKNGRPKSHFIQRLVLESFVGPKPEGFQAAHLNGIRTDNRIENLKWVSPKENSYHRELHGRTARGARHGMRIHVGKVAGDKNGRARLNRNQVQLIREQYRSGVKTQAQLARDYGVKEPSIWKIVNGVNWKR